MKTRARWIAISIAWIGGVVSAQTGWFDAGDVALRADLALLNDSDVIRLPVNQWPMPESALRFAMASAKDGYATNAAVSLALARVRARLSARDAARERSFAPRIAASAGEPALLREFGTVGRESLEVTASAEASVAHAGARLAVTGVADPADDRPLRLDGSYLSYQLGNWVLSAHTLERFWGPAHESSLILSNNARPMPTLAIDRATAQPFESRWLSWLGPWDMSFGVSRMESHREDIDAPLFLAWRVTVMPFHKVELGFSRTAQFCGKQLECNLNVFGNLLAGNDNVGIDATPQNEPGNQMAGFDIRLASPIGNLPYALYGQYIGEDESSYLPAKYLAQIGIESWVTRADGGLIQLFAEWADTSCSATSSRGPYFNCAYNQGRFNVEGYRYRGRVIGHTTDRDSRSLAVGASLVMDDGQLWTLTARKAELNRDGNLDLVNSVTLRRTDYAALEAGWRGQLAGQALEAQIGAESTKPTGAGRRASAYGFIRWTYDFAP